MGEEDRYKAILLANRFSWTCPPVVAGRLIQGSAPANNQPLAWRAAYTVLGSHYVQLLTRKRNKVKISEHFPALHPHPEESKIPAPSEPQGQKESQTSHKAASKSRSSAQQQQLPSTFTKDPTESATALADKRKFSLRLVLKVHTEKKSEKDDPTKAYFTLLHDWFEKVVLKVDDNAILVPFKIMDMKRFPAITSTRNFPTNASKFNPYCDKGCRPKWGSNWLQVHICTDEETINFTNQRGSTSTSWYDQPGVRDKNHTAYPATVQGSDDQVEIGWMCFTGVYADAVRFENELKLDMSTNPNGNKNWNFGCRVKKNKELPKCIRNGEEKFIMEENEVLFIEADRRQSKSVAKFLKLRFNEVDHYWQRPGIYNCRFVPAAAFVKRDTGNKESNVSKFRSIANIVSVRQNKLHPSRISDDPVSICCRQGVQGSIKNAIVLSDEEEENETAAAATPAAAASASAPPAAVLPHHTPPHGTSPGSAKVQKAAKKPRADREIVVLKVTVTVHGVTSAAGTLDQMVDMHPLTDKKSGDKNKVRLNGSWKTTLKRKKLEGKGNLADEYDSMLKADARGKVHENGKVDEGLTETIWTHSRFNRCDGSVMAIVEIVRDYVDFHNSYHHGFLLSALTRLSDIVNEENDLLNKKCMQSHGNKAPLLRVTYAFASN